MDTSKARRAIFDRIRQAQGRPESARAQERAAAQAYIAAHAIGPRPFQAADAAGRRAEFRRQCERLSTTVDEVAAMAEVPTVVARYLQGLTLPARAVAWPTLRELDWAGAGVAVEFRPPIREIEADRDHGDLVGITGCFCAIAETGSLMMSSGPDTFASATLLPETHIAVVPASRIVDSLEDGFARLRAEQGGLPRATNIISGPSRTGDIEQTIILGAHGPYRVHVVIVGDA